MDYMFFSCTNLKSLNIQSFNTNNCQIFEGIFGNCNGMELYINPNTCSNLFEYIPEYVVVHNVTTNDLFLNK